MEGVGSSRSGPNRIESEPRRVAELRKQAVIVEAKETLSLTHLMLMISSGGKLLRKYRGQGETGNQRAIRGSAG